MQIVLLILLIISSVFSITQSGEETKKEQEKLQGIWNAVSVEKGNQIRQVQPNELAQFIIENNKIKIKDSTIRKEKETELLYEIDLSKNPKTMFLKDTEGLNESGYATYILEGDTLVVDFSQKGDEKYVITFKRGKPFSDEETKKEQEKLQGIWNAVSVEKGNQIRQVQPNELAQFIIENNKIKIKDSTIRKKTETELLYEIDLSKNPKTMFLKDTEALNNSTYATYSLEGDILIIEVKNYFEDGREKIVFTLRKTKP